MLYARYIYLYILLKSWIQLCGYTQTLLGRLQLWYAVESWASVPARVPRPRLPSRPTSFIPFYSPASWLSRRERARGRVRARSCLILIEFERALFHRLLTDRSDNATTSHRERNNDRGINIRIYVCVCV